jgi:DNA polymerase IV
MAKIKSWGELEFNPKPSTILHIDLNSCFATIEQQANPLLRGKPVAVAAYMTPNGCILAPSVEAKRYGVKTGMRVKDGKLLCPGLIILPSDPWKYRNIHLALRQLLGEYTNDLTAKSIDEFVLNLENYMKVSPCFCKVRPCKSEVWHIAKMLKQRIKREIGEWLTVSVGIAPNRYLAKVAAGLHKPDGLDEINRDNYWDVYASLQLTDLPYIKARNAVRLNNSGIYNIHDFYRADIPTLKAAFSSVIGYYWHLKLRGWEIDDVEFGRRSYGNSYALPKPLVTVEELSPILSKLVTKTGARLRKAGYAARGVHLALSYRDGGFWHQGKGLEQTIFDSRDIYRQAYRLLTHCPYKSPVRDMSVSCFNLIKYQVSQLELFNDVVRKKKLIDAVDGVNERWGAFVITPARMIDTGRFVPDRIAFGNVKELEEFAIEKA